MQVVKTVLMHAKGKNMTKEQCKTLQAANIELFLTIDKPCGSIDDRENEHVANQI